MADAVLIFNCGSSSIKFALFGTEVGIARGHIEAVAGSPVFRAFDKCGVELLQESWKPDTPDNLLNALLCRIEKQLGGGRLAAAGHRIVHGGEHFKGPCLLTEPVRAALHDLEPLAPLHQAQNLAAVAAVARLRPGLPQYGCFDTAFHQTLGPLARRYALPQDLNDSGIRRYGFHGLSFESIAGRLREVAAQLAEGRILIAHLGSGASLCALEKGQSVDTSMGFSVLDGLVMGTRCGSLDPGILLYLLRKGWDVEALERLLYLQSGLLGVSGISADMRVLLASPEPAAAEAVALFAYRAAREAAALVATMGGLDGIVFTAGIGENSPEIRRLICARLAWLGVRLDPACNTENRMEIGCPSGSVKVWVLPTNEEAVIYRQIRGLLG